MAKGPSGPRVEWEQNLILPAGTDCRTKVTRSRNGGLGAMTVSTAAGKVLTGSGPQSLFGSFLVTQKGTRAAGRNLYIIKVGAT